MQFDPVLFPLLPAVGADGVEHRRELAAGLGQSGCLGGCQIEFDAERALHMRILPYIVQMFKYGRVRRFLRRRKSDAPRAVAMPYQYEWISLLWNSSRAFRSQSTSGRLR